MKSHLTILLSLFLVFGVSAREKPKPLFVESPSQNLALPPADFAQIVFIEPINSIQGLFPVGLFEINGETRSLLATTGAHSKAVVLLQPGKHILMANHSGMIAHFLEANVEAGKRYYVLLRFIYGRGFQMRPLRTNGVSDFTIANKDFPKWMSSTHFVDKTPESDIFFETNKDAVTKSQNVGWQNWQALSAQQKSELTLELQDSIPY